MYSHTCTHIHTPCVAVDVTSVVFPAHSLCLSRSLSLLLVLQIQYIFSCRVTRSHIQKDMRESGGGRALFCRRDYAVSALSDFRPRSPVLSSKQDDLTN